MMPKASFWTHHFQYTGAGLGLRFGNARVFVRVCVFGCMHVGL